MDVDGGSNSGIDGDDEFSGLRLDESFVRGASAKELSAEDRARRAQRLKAHEDEVAQRRKQVRRDNRIHRRLGRAIRSKAPSKGAVIVVVVLAVAAWFMFKPTQDDTTSDQGPDIAADSAAARRVDGVDFPPPRPTTGVRLDQLPERPSSTGKYRFLATQPGSAAPVAFDPCQTIPIVVNSRTAPPRAGQLVEQAVEIVATATGLRLTIEGATDEVPNDDRSVYNPARYGDRWSPVLLAWTDPAEYDGVAGDIAGRGGGDLVQDPDTGTFVYVSGLVALDGPQLAEVMASDDGWDVALAVVVHELAHLVGLDHVDDESSIMAPIGATPDLSNGDRAGLIELGSGPCSTKL